MESHGHVKLEWRDDLLIVTPKGPFNEEGSILAMKKYRDFVALKKYSHWYRLELWDEDSMGTVEVIDGVRKFYLWSKEQGCMATAVVVANELQAALVRKTMPDPVSICREEYEAIMWLEKQREQDIGPQPD